MLKKYSKQIRLAALTLLQTLIAAYHFFIIILVAFFPKNTNFEIFAGICVFFMIFAFPLIAGMILANDAKWWLISLPVQLLLSVAIQYTTSAVPSTFRGKVYDALVLLACQAIGVGIKLLFLKLRSRKRLQPGH